MKQDTNENIRAQMNDIKKERTENNRIPQDRPARDIGHMTGHNHYFLFSTAPHTPLLY
jgi:hypothetical protein